MAPLVEDTLLVVEGFKDATGFEYNVGDRAQVRFQAVRLAALKHPEWFRMEHAPVELDVDWLRDLHKRAETKYEQVKKARELQPQQQLREDRKTDQARKKDSDKLERQYREQQERQQAEQVERREALQRQKLETFPAGRGGFNF
jgi:hypothetical protein